MLDSQLIALLNQRMQSAVLAIGFGPMPVIQKDQPTQQGTASGPAAYFQKLFDIPRGWASTSHYTNGVTGDYVERTTQMYETTFQISAFYWQDPEKPDDQIVTASDIANQLLMWFVSRSQRRTLKALGLMILRVNEVRNPAFENDDHRFEYAPSFDIVFVHLRTIDVVVPLISAVEGDNHTSDETEVA